MSVALQSTIHEIGWKEAILIIRTLQYIPPNSEKKAEDRLFWIPGKLYVALDGVNAPYLPGDELPGAYGKTGGDIVVDTIIKTLAGAPATAKLTDNLELANTMVESILREANLLPPDVLYPPGAAFVAAKIQGDELTIVHGGDCLAVWELKDGSTGAMPHQRFECSVEEEEAFTKSKIQAQGDLRKAWELYIPWLVEYGKKWINHPDGLAIINGDEQCPSCWQTVTLPAKGIARLFVCTDGSIPSRYTQTSEQLAHFVLSLYHKGTTPENGLQEILNETLLQIEAESEHTWTDEPKGHTEASTLVVEF